MTRYQPRINLLPALQAARQAAAEARTAYERDMAARIAVRVEGLRRARGVGGG